MLLPLSYGWAGVAIFFVVSGFCIHLSFERQGREWKEFFIRRFFRIYPAYLLTLLVFALLFPATRLDFSSGHDGWLQFISHLLLIHNFNPQTSSAIDGLLWMALSLSEVQLYLIYPLLLMLVAKSGWRRTMFVLAVCEILIQGVQATLGWLLGPESPVGFRPFIYDFSLLFYLVKVSPLAYWFSWSLGAFVADAFLKGRRPPFAEFSFWPWLAVAAGSYLVKPLAPFSFLLFALATAIFISKYLSGASPKTHIPDFCLKFLRQTGILELQHLPPALSADLFLPLGLDDVLSKAGRSSFASIYFLPDFMGGNHAARRVVVSLLRVAFGIAFGKRILKKRTASIGPLTF